MSPGSRQRRRRPSVGDPAWLSKAGATPGPKAKDEPHPTRMRTPAAPLRGAGRLCQGTSPGRSRYSFVPGFVAIQISTGSPPQRRVQFGSAHGRGGSSGDPSYSGAAVRRGSGRPWDGALAPSPYSLGQLRADPVSFPDPPPGRGPVWPPRSVIKAGAAGVPSKRQDAGAAAEDTHSRAHWSSDSGLSSLRLAPSAPVRLRLAGRPVSQCLTKRLTSNTSLVCSRW